MKKLTTLNYSPVLKKLLVDYILRKYEEDAILDDWYLYQEYSWLFDNNRLNELFEEEVLINQLDNEYSR
jgi:hypothetical protein